MVDIAEAAAQAGSVQRASDQQAPALALALSRAFHDDPAFSWVLHHDAGRARMLERGFELFLRRVWLAQQETYTTAALAGVAVWERPGEWQTPIAAQLRLLPAMAAVFRRRLPRLLRAIFTLESAHPRQPDHYYLPFIGVDPPWQGRGLGSALLAPVLKRCDREGVPAFLEASTERNRTLYERHGFDVTEEFRLGRGAPLQWRMWREPGAGAAA